MSFRLLGTVSGTGDGATHPPVGAAGTHGSVAAGRGGRAGYAASGTTASVLEKVATSFSSSAARA